MSFFGGIYDQITDGLETVVSFGIDQEVEEATSSDESVDLQQSALPGGSLPEESTSFFGGISLTTGLQIAGVVVGVVGLVFALRR